jgi:hypothetical protein
MFQRMDSRVSAKLYIQGFCFYYILEWNVELQTLFRRESEAGSYWYKNLINNIVLQIPKRNRDPNFGGLEDRVRTTCWFKNGGLERREIEQKSIPLVLGIDIGYVAIGQG